MDDKYLVLDKLLYSAKMVLNEELLMERLNSGGVLVNGSIERDPKRKLYHGDEVQAGDRILVIDFTRKKK